MKEIKIKVSEDERTLQVVRQTHRGRDFAPPLGILFWTDDGRLLTGSMGPRAFYGGDSGKPTLWVRGTCEEKDMDIVQIPGPEWLEGIQKTIAAYNTKYGAQQVRKGSMLARKTA
jgi:hypothetical protein